MSRDATKSCYIESTRAEIKLKYVLLLALMIVTVIGFQNCGAYKASSMAGSGSSSSGSSTSATLQVDQALQTQSLAILNTRCASCHQTANMGGVNQILDTAHLIASGLVVVGNSSAGRLVGSIVDGTMPPGGGVSAADLQTIKSWIASMHYGSDAPSTPPPAASTPSSPLPAGKIAKADPTLHAAAIQILNVNCAGCHMGDAAQGFTDVLVLNNLVASGLVVAGDPSKGDLLGTIANGTMPQGTGARVQPADVQTLKNWISSITIVDAAGQTAMPTRPALASTFTGVFANVIQPKCVGCHGPVLQDSGKRFDSYTLVKAGIAGIQKECKANTMPQAPYPKLTTAEMNALNAWVAGGTLNN